MFDGSADGSSASRAELSLGPGGGASIYDLCGFCIKALERGVTRGHLLPPAPGALIQELYTTDGCGTLIARDVYDGIRLATAADVPGILALIAPLEARGILVARAPEVLARDVHSGFYYVYTRDDTMIACAQLKRYSPTHAEVGCLVVQSQYRRQGCGDAMLSFLERTAAAARVQHLFALSTHTMQWFVERGFTQCSLQDLPERRVALYNHGRASKIYIKPLMVCARAARPCTHTHTPLHRGARATPCAVDASPRRRGALLDRFAEQTGQGEQWRLTDRSPLADNVAAGRQRGR